MLKKQAKIYHGQKKKGGIWPQTKIPKNPFELTEEHSGIAIKIFELMKNDLFKIFSGIIDEKWINSIKIKSAENSEEESITIDSLWGGYTPDIQSDRTSR